LTGGEAHDCPVAERLIRRVKPSKRVLGDKAYDSAEPARGAGRARNQAGHSKPLQQETTVQLQQASLQAALAHRKCLQQAEGLQARRNPLRQARAKLPDLCLPRRRSCMVDLMSLDPNNQARMHLSLNKDAPLSRPIQTIGRIPFHDQSWADCIYVRL